MITLSVLAALPEAQAQDLYFWGNHPGEKVFIDRLHTLYGHNGDTFLLNTPLASVSDAYNLYNFYKTDVYNGVLSYRDVYRLNKLLLLDSDLSSGVKDPIYQVPQYAGWAGGYKNTPFLIEKKGQVNWLVQPVLSAYALADKDRQLSQQLSAGIYTRLTIGKRFGFQGQVHYTSEHLPDYFAERSRNVFGHSMPMYTESWSGKATPAGFLGEGVIPAFQATYDLIPQHLSVSAGYDQLFIGEGLRSLILGNTSSPMPYAALHTKVWKFDYTNIFLKPRTQNTHSSIPDFGMNKYVMMHYLSMNIGKRLNVGLFETVIASREGMLDWNYFNPFIFYRAVERHQGSPDKMALGLTASYVMAKGVKAYGQFFINEFVASEFFKRNGFVHNKWGTQLGVKYYDVAGLENLDIQAEVNIVRPYAYQHRSNSNFSNNNMPMAHPLGAGFREGLVRLSYQPVTKLHLQGRFIFYQQGADSSAAVNYGNDVTKSTLNLPSRYGVRMIHGTPVHVSGAELSVRYEILPNMYAELGGVYRQSKSDLPGYTSKDAMVFLGLQFHMNRRDLLLF